MILCAVAGEAGLKPQPLFRGYSGEDPICGPDHIPRLFWLGVFPYLNYLTTAGLNMVPSPPGQSKAVISDCRLSPVPTWALSPTYSADCVVPQVHLGGCHELPLWLVEEHIKRL